jgi:TRAP-type mannitol/chloroaromatic compound transport system substrate-binding protein
MSQRIMSQRAALVAVIVAFIVGIIGSLAIRPAGTQAASGALAGTDTAGENRIHWRVPIAFASNLPALGDNVVYVANTIKAASAGAVDLEIYEPNEIVPPFSITDAVRDGKVEAGYTWLGYDQGKIPASPLLGAVPFGMEPWEFSAWWFEAGGRELGQALYAKQNSHILFCGISGPETAGWFRNRIDSLEDMQGLKIRFAGLGGRVIERVGASVTMLPGGEIFQALEKGAIDATEYALPVVDQQLGFNRIAKYNYYPGWHQPATSSHLVINLDVWNNTAAHDQQLLEAVCTAGVTRNLARSEALQGPVIAGFPALGVSAETLPEELLRELQRISEVVLAEEAAKDDDFRQILASQEAFRADYALWKSRAYLPRDF